MNKSCLVRLTWGKGIHKISAGVSASWHTHTWIEGDNEKTHSKEIEININ